MSDVRNCKRCGKMFSYVSREICEDCVAVEQDDFKRVKEYLYEHSGASMTEVSRELKISTRKLTRYLREGRIEINEANSANLFLSCEVCGKSIRTGRYCDLCEVSLKKSLVATINAAKPPEVKEEKITDKKKTGGVKYLNKKISEK